VNLNAATRPSRGLEGTRRTYAQACGCCKSKAPRGPDGTRRSDGRGRAGLPLASGRWRTDATTSAGARLPAPVKSVPRPGGPARWMRVLELERTVAAQGCAAAACVACSARLQCSPGRRRGGGWVGTWRGAGGVGGCRERRFCPTPRAGTVRTHAPPRAGKRAAAHDSGGAGHSARPGLGFAAPAKV